MVCGTRPEAIISPTLLVITFCVVIAVLVFAYIAASEQKERQQRKLKRIRKRLQQIEDLKAGIEPGESAGDEDLAISYRRQPGNQSMEPGDDNQN